MSLRKIASGLAMAAALFSYAATASAQEKCQQITLPNGTVLTCQVGTNGQKTYVDDLGNSYPATTGGVGEFTIVNSSSNPCTAELLPTNIDLQSNNPSLGTIRTYLDPTRTPSLSRIRSNQASSVFPATEDFYFYAYAELSSRPGKRYRSINELHFNSPRVQSFNPHKQERFKLVEKVAFEDVDRPGRVAFTLAGSEIVLSGR